MKNLLSLSLLIGVCCILFVTGSFNKKGPACFQTKADSINFAKSVIDLYRSSESRSNNLNSPKEVSSFSDNKFEPVTWATILDFSAGYDANPVMTSGGAPIKGLMIDEAGLTEIRKLDPKITTKLYLRFGRKSNADYTVMILPVNTAGDVSKTDSSNYDHLNPCPHFCPRNFQ